MKKNENDVAFLKRKQLPEGFANEVLDKEMSIDDNNFDVDTVNRLIYLYSQAIEFYEGYDQEKYKSYYQRLQNLVLKPVVHKVMRNEKPDKK